MFAAAAILARVKVVSRVWRELEWCPGLSLPPPSPSQLSGALAEDYAEPDTLHKAVRKQM